MNKLTIDQQKIMKTRVLVYSKDNKKTEKIQHR